MLTAEFDIDEAREVWEEEAELRGRQLGEQLGERRGELRGKQLEALHIARTMKQKGLSDNVIIEITQLTPCDMAGLFAGA